MNFGIFDVGKRRFLIGATSVLGGVGTVVGICTHLGCSPTSGRCLVTPHRHRTFADFISDMP